MITGKIPFPELESDISVLTAVVQKESTPRIDDLLSEPLSPRSVIMVGVLHRCWQYDPKERATVVEVEALVNPSSCITF